MLRYRILQELTRCFAGFVLEKFSDKDLHFFSDLLGNKPYFRIKELF